MSYMSNIDQLHEQGASFRVCHQQERGNGSFPITKTLNKITTTPPEYYCHIL
jgi:hypothetical protein